MGGHLGKTQYRINKVLSPSAYLILILISVWVLGLWKTGGRSGFVDTFTFKLHKNKPASSQYGYDFLVLPLCRGRAGSAVDSGKQHDLTVILLQPGQISGWWERGNQPISPETENYCCNSFLSLSPIAGTNPLSLASHLDWPGSSQSVTGLDLRGQSSAKVRERAKCLQLENSLKSANIPGVWMLSGSV